MGLQGRQSSPGQGLSFGDSLFALLEAGAYSD